GKSCKRIVEGKSGHPEPHRRRRTSQALKRFRVRLPIYVMSRVPLRVRQSALVRSFGVLCQPQDDTGSGASKRWAIVKEGYAKQIRAAQKPRYNRPDDLE